MTDGISRRAFLGTGTAIATHAALANRATAQQVVIPDAAIPNAIPTGVIGVGGRGTNVMRGVLQHGKVAAVCDTHAGRLQTAAQTAARDTPATFADYRRLLDRMTLVPRPPTPMTPVGIALGMAASGITTCWAVARFASAA